MYVALEVTHRTEPAFIAAAAKLDALPNTRRSGVSSYVAMVLRFAHSELTDYGAQQPATYVEVDLEGQDAIALIDSVIEDLTALRAQNTSYLADVLRVTRALDRSRTAADVARFELEESQKPAVDEDGPAR